LLSKSADFASKSADCVSKSAERGFGQIRKFCPQIRQVGSQIRQVRVCSNLPLEVGVFQVSLEEKHWVFFPFFRKQFRKLWLDRR
jgi:hypothetical protein